jgi:hypothetical protein
MEMKSFESVELSATPQGRFRALIATFNRPDKMGDLIRPGAFAATIQAWRAKGGKVPVVFSHQSSDPAMHIGEVDPANLQETAAGLEATGDLYLDEPNAAKVHKQLVRKALREWSFGFLIAKSKPLGRMGRELLEVTLIELGPTVAGVGDTATLAVKSDTTSPVLERRQALARMQLAPFQARLGVAKRRIVLARLT